MDATTATRSITEYTIVLTEDEIRDALIEPQTLLAFLEAQIKNGKTQAARAGPKKRKPRIVRIECSICHRMLLPTRYGTHAAKHIKDTKALRLPIVEERDAEGPDD